VKLDVADITKGAAMPLRAAKAAIVADFSV